MFSGYFWITEIYKKYNIPKDLRPRLNYFRFEIGNNNIKNKPPFLRRIGMKYILPLCDLNIV